MYICDCMLRHIGYIHMYTCIYIYMHIVPYTYTFLSLSLCRLPAWPRRPQPGAAPPRCCSQGPGAPKQLLFRIWENCSDHDGCFLLPSGKHAGSVGRTPKLPLEGKFGACGACQLGLSTPPRFMPPAPGLLLLAPLVVLARVSSLQVAPTVRLHAQLSSAKSTLLSKLSSRARDRSR